MDKESIDVIFQLNEDSSLSQRSLASRLNISLGKVNGIINSLISNGYIERSNIKGRAKYIVTESGIELLGEEIKEKQSARIELHSIDYKETIKEAIILAAGQCNDFDFPVGLVEINGEKLIDRTIKILREVGINKVIIVTGYKNNLYEDHFRNCKDIELVYNERYKWTGSMDSLNKAKGLVKGDFILLESDVVFEKRALVELMKNNNTDCIVLTNESGFGDEVFVEIKDGFIFKMSKDIHAFNKIDGEMLGIVKISEKMYDMMINEFEGNLNPYMNYEYLLLDVASTYKLGYVKIDSLIWGEIDTAQQLDKVKSFLFPQINIREIKYERENIKELISKLINCKSEDILQINSLSNVLNKSYRVELVDRQYILRISNTNEVDNYISSESAKEANKDGILLEGVCSADNKTTIIELPREFETLTARSCTKEENLRACIDLLKDIHNGSINMEKNYSVFKEIKEYYNLIKGKDTIYKGIDEIVDKVLGLEECTKLDSKELKPCHNEIIPEDFIKDKCGKMYFSTWRSAGNNDVIYDLAYFILECDMKDEDKELFLNLYYNRKVDKKVRYRISIYKICINLLISIKILLDGIDNEDFYNYGLNRFKLAKSELSNLKIN